MGGGVLPLGAPSAVTVALVQRFSRRTRWLCLICERVYHELALRSATKSSSTRQLTGGAHLVNAAIPAELFPALPRQTNSSAWRMI